MTTIDLTQPGNEELTGEIVKKIGNCAIVKSQAGYHIAERVSTQGHYITWEGIYHFQADAESEIKSVLKTRKE